MSRVSTFASHHFVIMKYKKLGSTDLDVSVICLGTMTWGEQNTESEAHEQLDFAVSRGINFIDTAELYPVPARGETYGRTEDYIGTWISKRGKRDDLILASKVCGPGPYTSHIRSNPDFSIGSIEEALEGSLRRLQTDYLDLYQVHWPARQTNFFSKRGFNKKDEWQDNIAEVVEGLDRIVKSGKVRYVGISNETPWGVMRYLQASDKADHARIQSIQNPYNLLNRTFEVGLSEMAIREKLGLLAYSPMAFGLLSGKYHKKTDQPQDRLNQFKGHMARYSSEQSQLATDQYLKIAEEHGLSLAQMSLAWINQQQFVTANIIGATNLTQLEENISSIDIELDRTIIKAINRIHAAIPNPAP